ncbi:GNAT family N-acetyltransferase [Ruegeria hyattellae]|uniref:GNAT family N-acetyltransferase n=1 Tax=Ruegeria hyattellae TaxID=3233337 RepID=UPI00355B70F2
MGLRAIDTDACEMKRMFVDPKFHGQDVGLALATHLTHRARELGYARMYLDTGPEQIEVRGLYQRLGFQPIKPYYDVSDEMADWLTFMVLQFDTQGAGKWVTQYLLRLCRFCPQVTSKRVTLIHAASKGSWRVSPSCRTFACSVDRMKRGVLSRRRGHV